MSNINLAAIDLGTNSCRLRITDQYGNVIYRESVATKLGEKMTENMCFTQKAVERGLSCLNRYAELMKNYKVGKYRAIATASCRMAKNGAEFVQQVEKNSGIRLEVVSPQEEAMLNLRGAALNAPKEAETVLVYDLGGGSTEITLAINSKEPEMIYTVSIPWGARNASENFDLCEYNEEKAVFLKAEVKKYIENFVRNSDYFKYVSDCCAIATSSTALRLMNMIHNNKVYDRDFADGLSAHVSEYDKQIEKIYNSNLQERIKNPHIGETRADIIIAAGVIFQTIYKELKIKQLVSSLKGAQDAIISDLMKESSDNGKIN